MKTLCVVTGTRAEYGLLKGLLGEIKDSEDYQLLLFVTGSHLEEKHGYTYKVIEGDGFEISEKIPMALDDDTAAGITRSMAKEMAGLAGCFARHVIDVVIVLGDRYEMLVAAQVALINNIDVWHFCGGDVTRGAYDDAIRNAITKMAKRHFVTCQSSYNNILRMGENREDVRLVGNPGLSDIVGFVAMGEDDLYKALGIRVRDRLILVVNHSETLLKREDNETNMNILCEALAGMRDFGRTAVVFVHPNADNDNEYIRTRICGLVDKYDNVHAFPSLERDLYLSVLYYSDCIVGNSSSGIYEAPLLGKVTLNLGGRQSGRECGNTVIHIAYDAAAICRQLDNIPLVRKATYPYLVRSHSQIFSMLDT